MLGFGIIKRLINTAVFFTVVGVAICFIVLLQVKDTIYKDSLQPPTIEAPEPFPVSVNMATEEIIEDSGIEYFYQNTFAQAAQSKNRWWNQVAAVFSGQNWFQNMASPVSRIIVIWPGERKEEVTKNIAGVLRWDEAQKAEFQQLIDTQEPALPEGKYFPGQYVTHRYASPADIAELISAEFEAEITSRYPATVSNQVPLADALIIASLLEREASDFTNMREISGVIWNRLFIDMRLQLDATLQYVKADGSTTNWWPVVRPADKFLESPFNTYENTGLPPSPIANPSAESVLAALNPIKTDCIYYFHDTNADYYCSVTYEEHVRKLRIVYGQGS